MRNLKRVLSLALALVMVLGMMVITTSAADFTDADEITNTEAVEVLSAIGMVQGDNGAFNPNGYFTREAAAKLITYMLIGGDMAEKLAGTDVFTDVAADRWSAKYIAYCANLGYITGVGNDQFNPTGILKDIELGKLVLCALGFDPAKYTGPNWASAVTVDLLAEGLVAEVTGEAITREDACAMILAAMTWTDGGDIYTVYVESGAATGYDDADTFVKVYTDAIDAYFAASAITNGKVDIATSDDYLLNSVFGVDVNSDPDVYGRPGTTYYLNDTADTVLKYTKTPVATFNTVVSEKDMFAALGAKGAAGSGNRYVTLTKIVEDGRTWNSVIGAAATWTIENDDNSAVPGTGNGIVVEIYKNYAANTYTMVCVREWAGTVTGVTPANATAGTPRKVTITMNNSDIMGYPNTCTFVTENYEVEDVVLCNLAVVNDAVKVLSVKTPEFISGKVTKITNSSIYTIGENTVKLSQLNTCGAPSLNASGSWYVDSCGNLIATKSADSATKYYGYLLDYEVSDKASGNLLGAGATEAAEKFEFVDSTGEVVVLDGAFTTKANGKVDQYVAKKNGSTASLSGTDWAVDYADVLFAYELNADGEISKVYAATDATGTNRTVTKGNATASGSSLLLTEKTVFFYVDTTNDKYVTYTGYNNVPVTKTGTELGRIYANDTLSAMVLSVDSIVGQSAANYVYFGSLAKTEETTAAGTVVTYTNVYINGVKAENGLVVASGSPSAGGLYTFTTNTQTGAATVATGTNLIGSPDEIVAIQNDFFKATSAGIKYVDEDTVYYIVDTNANTIAIADGLTALSSIDAYSVNLLKVVDGGAANDPASLVVFNIGA